MSEEFKQFEQKLTTRFIVEFDNLDIPKYFIHSITLPTLVVGEGWGDIKITMFDPVDISIPKRLMNELTDFYGIKKDTRLKLKVSILTATGDTIEEWWIEGWVLSINFGEYTWKTEAENNISMVIKVKECNIKCER